MKDNVIVLLMLPLAIAWAVVLVGVSAVLWVAEAVLSVREMLMDEWKSKRNYNDT